MELLTSDMMNWTIDGEQRGTDDEEEAWALAWYRNDETPNTAAPSVFGRTATPEMLASILDGRDGLGDIDAAEMERKEN
jgi:hypothetical protein